MYKNGSVGFIDVLLGSSSISEFVSNLEMIQKIYKNDMNVLQTLEQEQKELEAIKEELSQQKAQLDVKMQELETNLAELNALKAELEKEEDRLLEEAEALTEKIKQLTASSGEYVGGIWQWPAPASKTLTSYYGWRIHPVYGTWKYHSGIDIAASNASNVVAAASGKVILSQWYGGYGECIMIDHGGGLVSLYGHMLSGSRKVSVGDYVSAGQVIGLVGSTGVSTGPHLHFEVRINGELTDPLDYVS
jgi:murein DD-endopeptidase MepM/ murein hydrolase activator NlpD